MVLVTADQLQKSFGDRALFHDVSFSVQAQDRIGFVGINGTGKSTLLRILADREPVDAGEIIRARDLRIEYLAQDPQLEEDQTAFEQLWHNGPPAFECIRRYQAACRALQAAPHDADRIEKVTALSTQMEALNAWSIEHQARSVFSQLSINDPDQSVSTMSGGQRKRVALARALLRPADLLLLDEPTNHLDIEAIEWLESYLANYPGALLMITHDRYFLDRVVNQIFELAEKTVFAHAGNYSAYLQLRAARREQAEREEAKRSNLARRELEWLRRGPKARTTKSKVRVERAVALQTRRHPQRSDPLSIETVESRLGRKVVVLNDIAKRFDSQTVLNDFSYSFRPGERVGIIGPNGVGKSTLLNLITGRLMPDQGHIEVGETVVFGYYDQRAEQLDPSNRVHEYIADISNRIETADGELTAAQMLERFLFDRHRQWEYIGKLSGGEKRRLYLLGILMRAPNVLLLDEPTNDLDVETLAVLESYLDRFSGVLLTVSHDRFFLDRCVEHLLVFGEQGHVEEFPGGFSEWAEARKARPADTAAVSNASASTEPPADPVQAPLSNTPKKLSFNEVRELNALETRIEAIETRLSELDELLIAHAADYTRVLSYDEERQALATELEMALERWAELAERQT